MKMTLTSIVMVMQAMSSLALVLKSPQKRQESLLEQREDVEGAKLIPTIAKTQRGQNKHHMRVQMLARDEANEKEPVKGCIACFGVQVVYGKYQNAEGDAMDNSYYIFKDPAHKKGDEDLPIIIQFHAGGFVEGAPWTKENEEINAYLSKGFAVVSVGYRLATEKYFFESKDGDNKTEELIHVSKDGKLSLDSTGKTMGDYKVRIGKQEHITKYLYDATQMMEHLIENSENLGLDVNRIVFAGESTGGAGMQYLIWVYHKWNQGRYTPRGLVYQNAQLNYPVHNMLGDTWDLFTETMGPQVRLSDVVSEEACPTIIGNHMCGSALGKASDYDLCNEEWNKQSLKHFCGEALKTATLGQARARQVWPREDKEVGRGMEKLWYNSENMQHHLPYEPFYMYVANSMNGTGPVDVAHHSIFALNFAKFAEMGKEGGLHYSVYYTDFAHMTEADRGMQRFEVSRAPDGLGDTTPLALAPAAAAPGVASPAMAVGGPGAARAVGPAPAPGPAPGPAPAPAAAGKTVFNYLSTHDWREMPEAKDMEAGSLEERVLYACLAARVGPFKELEIAKNETDVKESGALGNTMHSTVLTLVMLAAMFCSSF